jgi:hypothetical protein
MLLLFVLNPISCFTKDLDHLMQQINQIRSDINYYKNDAKILSGKNQKLENFLPCLKTCDQNQQDKIAKIEEALSLLNNIENNQSLLRRKNKRLLV